MKAVFLIGILACFSLASCKTVAPVVQNEDRPLIYVGSYPAFEEMGSFRKIMESSPGTSGYERARIEYLLERIAHSPYNFVRAGSKYKSGRAAAFLRWKYLRIRDRVHTAEDFIDQVATRSKMEGSAYLLQITQNEFYTLRTAYLNELELLDKVVLEHREEAAVENQPEEALAVVLAKEVAASEGPADGL